MKTAGKNNRLASLFIRFGILCSIISLLHIRFVSASYEVPDFYYYYDERIYLNLSTELISICFEDHISNAEKTALIREDPILEDLSNETLPYGLVLIETKQGLDSNDISESIERLNELPEIKYITPVFQSVSVKLILMDEFIVRFRPDITKQQIEAMNKENGIAVVSKSPYRQNRYVLRIINPKDKNAIKVANFYNENQQTKYACPNFLLLGAFQNSDPDDTYFQEQWPLNNTGQTGGTEDADMDAPEGWQITTGSSEIIIAIIDSGTDIYHEDLMEKIWVNAGEIPGNGIDDDGNGYEDDIYGYDFVNTDNDPMDDFGHGTHCAGIIAAEGNNELDIVGVSWNAKIMAVRIGPGPGIVVDAAIAGIRYAADNGADILSNSWGGYVDLFYLKEAIKYATDSGVIVLASAGNNNNNQRTYPASYDHVISVAATDSNDDRYSLSTYGDWVDLAAPGVNILSLRADGTDAFGNGNHFYPHGDDANATMYIASGTSMSCPYVAGACAMVLSIDPTLGPNDVNEILTMTADELADANICASGRLNVNKAVL